MRLRTSGGPGMIRLFFAAYVRGVKIVAPFVVFVVVVLS